MWKKTTPNSTPEHRLTVGRLNSGAEITIGTATDGSPVLHCSVNRCVIVPVVDEDAIYTQLTGLEEYINDLRDMVGREGVPDLGDTTGATTATDRELSECDGC